jgi:hypothetical protein
MNEEVCVDCGEVLTAEEYDAGSGRCFACQEVWDDEDAEEREAIEADEELGP